MSTGTAGTDASATALPAADGVARRDGSWRALTAICLVLLAFVAVWPGTQSMLERWNDTVYRTYTHGWLIFGIVVWLLWRGRSGIPAPRFTPAALVLQLALAVAWLVSYRAGLQIVYWALTPLIAAAALLTAFGWRAARPLAFAAGYSYLAIPVWDALLPLLQWFSVIAVRFMLRLTGIPVYFSGNAFELPSGTFEIADGCSGLHFFIVAVAIALLHGELNRDRLRTRMALLALATGFAVLTNWIRIYILVVVGHVSEMRHYLVAEEHYTFGWYMFAGVMVVYFLITRRWPAPAPGPAASSAAAEHARGSAVSMAGLLVAVAGLLSVSGWLLVDRNEAGAAQLSALEPRTPAGWEAVPLGSSNWQPRFVAADREQRRQFVSGERQVETHIAMYARQTQGRELVGFGNSAVGEGWRVMSARPQVSPSARSGQAWSEQIIANGAGETWMLWTAHRLDGDWFSSDTVMQLSYGWRSLAAAPAAAALLVRARCKDADCADARTLLQQFTSAAWD